MKSHLSHQKNSDIRFRIKLNSMRLMHLKSALAHGIFVNSNSSFEEYSKRINYQTDALISLRTCGYLLQIAQEVECILMNQFESAALKLGNSIQSLILWRQSDMKRRRNAGVVR